MRRWFVVFFLLGIFFFSAVVPPSWVSGLPLCYLKGIFGINCPGCGLSRGFIYLFHGEFRKAIEMNAMVPVLVVWFWIYIFKNLYLLRKGSQPSWFTEEGNRWISRSFLILFIGQFALKNLPIIEKFLN